MLLARQSARRIPLRCRRTPSRLCPLHRDSRTTSCYDIKLEGAWGPGRQWIVKAEECWCLFSVGGPIRSDSKDPLHRAARASNSWHSPQMQAEEQPNKLAARKQRIRDAARQKRQAQSHRDRLSRQVLDHCRHLAEYSAAQTLLYYVGTRFEVGTREELAHQLTTDKTIVVPYCEQGQPGACRLGLCRLKELSELERGMYGIEEPNQNIRAAAGRFVDARDVDLVVVPGVAFDRSGRRLGYGRGYYDQLLQRLRPDTLTIGLAFECQLFPELPHEPHDVPVDMVITEHGVYR